jgi:hypothetical protein
MIGAEIDERKTIRLPGKTRAGREREARPAPDWQRVPRVGRKESRGSLCPTPAFPLEAGDFVAKRTMALLR